MDLLNELGPEASKFMNYAPDDLMHFAFGRGVPCPAGRQCFAGQSRPLHDRDFRSATETLDGECGRTGCG